MKFIHILLAFTLIPVVELFLLLYIHSKTSFLFTFSLIIFTGIFGTYLAKREGRRNFRKIREEMAQGKVPGSELLEAVLIFVAGALLITPGVLTDFLGFSLLIPFSRKIIAKVLSKKFKNNFKVKKNAYFSFSSSYHTNNSNVDDDIIDVEVQDVSSGEDQQQLN